MAYISLGAINKLTGEYVYPKIANKKDEYVCPECNKDLILVRGEIRVPHFRHKVDSVSPCYHYSNPTESQIHKDAKKLLKHLLEKRVHILFVRTCISCKKNSEFEIPEISEKSKIIIEHRFEYNGEKQADIAYLDDDKLSYIFEICNTHKTFGEDRPEPWFEIKAETLIKMANDDNLTSLKIPCIRDEKCEDCIEKEKRNSRQIKPDIDEEMYVYFHVDFHKYYEKKDKIKEYGGKWDNKHKLWYFKKSVYDRHCDYMEKNIGDKIYWYDNTCDHCGGCGIVKGSDCWFCTGIM